SAGGLSLNLPISKYFSGTGALPNSREVSKGLRLLLLSASPLGAIGAGRSASTSAAAGIVKNGSGRTYGESGSVVSRASFRSGSLTNDIIAGGFSEGRVGSLDAVSELRFTMLGAVSTGCAIGSPGFV